jgi:hypothetical protein
MAARDETVGLGSTAGRGLGNTARRLTTETKQFFKTSEFVAYVVVFVGILIAANSIEGNGGNDYFTADKAWLYITLLTLGYMLSRGIAKSGVREPYSSGGDGDDAR